MLNDRNTRYKGYIISPHKMSPTLYALATEGKGGKIPNCLSGMYTTVVLAKAEVDRYLNSKVKTDAKTADEGGG